eukprot:1191911-Prorocentrum_minimum.AAC.11
MPSTRRSVARSRVARLVGPLRNGVCSIKGSDLETTLQHQRGPSAQTLRPLQREKKKQKRVSCVLGVSLELSPAWRGRVARSCFEMLPADALVFTMCPLTSAPFGSRVVCAKANAGVECSLNVPGMCLECALNVP